MDVLMPQLGETVAEGTISAWRRSVGDAVAAGETLFEIETDKVSMEVQATESGVLTEIRVPAGETVPVGTVVAVIGDGAPSGKTSAPTPAASRAGNGADSQPAPAAASHSPFDAVRTPTVLHGRARGPFDLKVTPLARRLISQRNLDLEAIARAVRDKGGWRIAAADVAAVTPRPAGDGAMRAPVPEHAAGDRIEGLNPIRQRTARRLAESWRTVPHVFQAVEADFTRLDQARRKARQAFADQHGVKLTILPFVARAVCLALAAFPRLNAQFQDERLVLRRDVNLGIAVDLGHEGLVVPVVRQAQTLSLPGLAVAIAALVDKSRARKLTPEDLADGTYSITNNGSFGTLFTTPIINMPQVAILSLDAVVRRPVVLDTSGDESIAVRSMGMLGQSFDHRAFDGAYAAAFLARLKEIVETRDWAAELG